MTGNDHRGEIHEITALELKERLDSGQPLILVDVREAFEREIADLPDVGQKRIPMDELPDRLDELDPDDNLVLYCRSGSRSNWAAEQLVERGYTKVFNLTGGVLGWADAVDPSMRRY